MKRFIVIFLWIFTPVVSYAGWWDDVFGSSFVKESEVEIVKSTPMKQPERSELKESIAQASDYKLGPGDKIAVSVFNEKDLSVVGRLSDAGTFSFPLLGEVRAKGMTTGLLQDFLIQQLSDGYLINPQVYVEILEYRQFFVTGEVVKPGGILYQPGLTVRKAIALAGGFTPRASQTKIFILHEDSPTAKYLPISLDDYLFPGDILTIEQSFF